MAKKTRVASSMYLFGTEKDILPEKTIVLPTYEDMIRCFYSVRLSLKGDGKKQPESRKVANIVAQKIQEIWHRASLPTLSHRRIIEMILQFNNEYQKLLKPVKSRKTTFLAAKLEKFKNNARRLFDICSCKCKNKLSCNCDKTRKIPDIEWPFIEDQRSIRKMAIGNVDKKVTANIKRKIERKLKDSQASSTYSTNSEMYCKDPVAGPSGIHHQSQNLTISDGNNSDTSTSSESSNDEDFVSPKEPKPKKQKMFQMRHSLLHTAKVADLTGVSSRTAAKIATAVLEDMRLITKDDAVKVVDKNKIRREVNKNRLRLQKAETKTHFFIKGLYFDGRKDQTMFQEKGRRVTKTEEHITLVEEPGSLYCGHLALTQSRAIDIAEAIVNDMKNRNIELNHWKVIGCDGTNVNTGWKGGVLRLLENQLSRPLQWSICLLHANELPLRHLLQKLDGGTKGPCTHSGPIGSLLPACEKMPVVQFEPIQTELPQVNEKDLSTDQQYLFQMCKAVGEGICSTSLAERNPGKMAHSRWLTTANRILRLYIATPEPSDNFQILVKFVIQVYSRMWFAIKTEPRLENGAKHLWKMISLSRGLPNNIKIIIDKVIQDNAYFAHPENVLVAMLVDTRQHIRELAVRRILKARKLGIKKRIFKIPKINFDAEDYIDLIDWSNCVISEPPLTKDMSDEQLLDIIKSEESPFDFFPCHTQAVERYVKVITDASSKVCGEKSRDGYIRAKLDARTDLPKFDNKGQYYATRN